MFKPILVGVVLALGLAGSAAAEPFDSFRRFCMQSEVGAAGVARTAAKLNWFAMPEEGLAPARNGGLNDPVMFLNHDPHSFRGRGLPADLEAVFGAWTPGETFGVPSLTADICVALATGANPTDLEAKVATLFDFPPAEIDGKKLWFFSRTEAGLRSEMALVDLPPQALERVVRERRIYAAAVMAEGDLSGMMVGAFRVGD